MRIIGLAIVAATAFGVWSASRAVEGWEGSYACGVGWIHRMCLCRTSLP